MTIETKIAKSGTEAFKIIHDFLGKEISFSNVSEGYNREDIFTFTAGEGIFVTATCTPGNSRIEAIEILNTNESGSARHPLTVYINADEAESTATAKKDNQMTIETKIAKNGNVNFYAKGKRIKEQDAVYQAIMNGGTYYTANSYSYHSGRCTSGDFLSPITAYKWLRRLASKSNNHADGSWIIERHENHTCTKIYEYTNNVYKCEDAALEAYIEERNNAENVESSYRAMIRFVEFYSKHYGLTVEQAEQIAVTVYAAEPNKQYDTKAVVKRMIDEFRAVNTHDTVEADAAEYAVSADAQEVALQAEVELAAQNVNTVVEYLPIIEHVEITEEGNEFRRFTVNNETVTYFNGELNFIKSDTYHASLAAYRNQYVVEVPDGRWKKFKRLDADEFHQIMSERGACSIDKPADVDDACEAINGTAPEGWKVDAANDTFSVKFNGQSVATLDSLILAKILPPENFFEQFKPLTDENFDAKKQFIADRQREIEQLIELRKELTSDSDRQKIDELIRQNKHDMIHTELAS